MQEEQRTHCPVFRRASYGLQSFRFYCTLVGADSFAHCSILFMASINIGTASHKHIFEVDFLGHEFIVNTNLTIKLLN